MHPLRILFYSTFSCTLKHHQVPRCSVVMFLALPLSLLLLLSSSLVAAQSAPSQIPPTPSSSSGVPVSSSSGSAHSVSGSVSATGSMNSSVSSSASATNTADYPSLSGYSSCVDNCLALAIADTGCDSIVDVDCYCASANATTFASHIVSCMSSYCPSSLTSAESLSNMFCAVASPSTTLSFPTPSLTSASGSAGTAMPSSMPLSASSSSGSASISATSPSGSASRTSASSSGSPSPSQSASAAHVKHSARMPSIELVVVAGVGLALLEALFGW
ncbi:hypothetical protein AcW1_003901 [Taiwanofungus camphoratus]|nr:hypothetical protein AcW1_003901 [Antrodia cinnamomea]